MFFVRIGKKYSLKKRDNPPEDLKSLKGTVNEIMETITSNENDTNSK